MIDIPEPVPNRAQITTRADGTRRVVLNGRDVSDEIDSCFTIRVEGAVTWLDVSYCLTPGGLTLEWRRP